jgi:hypothetical protein
MDNTFPKRRRDVVGNNTRVWKILHDYPFLKNAKGIEVGSSVICVSVSTVQWIWFLLCLKATQVNNIILKICHIFSWKQNWEEFWRNQKLYRTREEDWTSINKRSCQLWKSAKTAEDERGMWLSRILSKMENRIVTIIKWSYFGSPKWNILYFAILEMENRCIMASLPFALGDRHTHQNKTGELFWEILDASLMLATRERG